LLFSDCLGHVFGPMKYCMTPMRSDVPDAVWCGPMQ